MGILSGILTFLGCGPQESSNKAASDSSGLVATQIKIDGLTNELQKLREGKTEYDFIGITSTGVDCIYFVKEEQNFQIEFEALVEQQLPYVEKLKTFATSNGYKVSMTTYGNKPKYTTASEAPVVRIETNSDLENTARIGTIIQRFIFGNGEATVYNVVP